MTTLCELEDVEAVLGRDITGAELIRVVRLIEMADREIRRYTGQHFERAETTDRLRIRSNLVRLPQRPVHDVTSVEDTAGSPVLFTWTVGDLLQVGANVIDSFAWEPWRNDLTYVDVTYDHGYDIIPADVARICAEIAASALSSPADGIRQAQVDDVSIVRSNPGGAVRLTLEQREALSVYRTPASTITVSPRF